ncbi:hypothetical protein [Acidimangrovimonas pyrenivorans]|uniref:Flagellar protein FliL n=1 Tax=Acidimangrovimonas pyrenivorans TaxID=2030798 RepID=A0ABV7AMN9_9RHOB
MLKPLALLLGLPLICGGVGYGAGLFLSPDPVAQAKAAEAAQAPETIPLGRVVVQIYKARQVTYLATDLAVTVKGRANAIALASPATTTALRDRALTVLTDAAQTPLLHEDKIDKDRLAELLRIGLVKQFPRVEKVEVRAAATTDSPRS